MCNKKYFQLVIPYSNLLYSILYIMTMKSKYIITIIFVLILIVLLFITFCKSWGLYIQEGATNINSNIGNVLSQYFHHLIISILKKEDFNYTLPDEDFLNRFPSYLPYTFDDVRVKLLENGIDKNYFETVQTLDVSTWCLKDNKSEKMWLIMKPLVQKIYDAAFNKTDVNTQVEYPVIHFRCADTPFVRHEQYHFQKYAFYKKALDNITKKIKKYDKVIISYCNTHLSDKQNQHKCDVYVNSLVDYLKSIGYDSILKCQTNLDDFAMMYYAPALISPGSSYSFMSGFFGRGLFISAGHQEENRPEFEGIGDWLYKGYNVMHSEVPDYYDSDKVIKILSK